MNKVALNEAFENSEHISIENETHFEKLKKTTMMIG